MMTTHILVSYFWYSSTRYEIYNLHIYYCCSTAHGGFGVLSRKRKGRRRRRTFGADGYMRLNVNRCCCCCCCCCCFCGGGGGTDIDTISNGLLSSSLYISLQVHKGVFGTVRTEAYRRYIPPVLPVPGTSVSSVRHQYRYRTLR